MGGQGGAGDSLATAAAATAAATAGVRNRRPPTATAGFIHGVASFDPLPDGIIIWTRVTPASSADSAAVDWQVSKREDFSSLAARWAHARGRTRAVAPRS
jgi:alkaline phosphatase D